MLVVVDASAVVHMLLSGRDGPLGGHQLAAPPLLGSEVTSVISELAWRAEIPRDRARAAVRRLGSASIRYERPVKLYERAIDIAEALGWAKTYDAEYIALAELLNVPLVTLDDRLRRRAADIVTILAPTELK